MLSSGILTLEGWTSLSLSVQSVPVRTVFCVLAWSRVACSGKVACCCVWSINFLARMNHTCALVSLSSTEQLSCALLSFSIPCEPACQFPWEAIHCSALQCHFLFAFLASLSFPVTHKCLGLTSVSCHNRLRDCLQIKSRFDDVLGEGPYVCELLIWK